MCTDQVYYAGEQSWLSIIHLTCPTSERVCPWPSLPSLGDTWRTAPRWEPVSGCDLRMEMWQSGHFNYDSGISHQLTQEGVFLPSPSAWSSWCLPASPRGQPHGTSSGAEIRREGNIFHISLISRSHQMNSVYSIMTLFHYTLIYYFPFFQNDREGFNIY